MTRMPLSPNTDCGCKHALTAHSIPPSRKADNFDCRHDRVRRSAVGASLLSSLVTSYQIWNRHGVKAGLRPPNAMIDASIRLRRAILLNDVTIVRRIVHSNPKLLQNPDFGDKSNTSLHIAAQAGFDEIVVSLDCTVWSGHDRSLLSPFTAIPPRCRPRW